MSDLFAAEPGSRGDGSDDISLLVPFVPAPDRNLPKNVTIELLPNNLKASIQVGQYGRHILSVTGFDSLEAADSFAETIVLWLRRALLKDRVGIHVYQGRGEISWAEKPWDGSPNFVGVAKAAGWQSFDGIYDMTKITAIPEGKRLLRMWMGDARVIIGLSEKGIAEKFAATAGITLPLLPDRARLLSTAVEIFSLSFFETSDRAKLILRVAALEPLSEPAPIEIELQSVLNNLISVVEKEMALSTSNAQEGHRNIVRQLAAMKEGGIARRFRKSFSRILHNKNFQAAGRGKLAERFATIYTLRCNIAHGNKPPVEEVSRANDFLESAFPEIIDALWEEARH